VDHQLQQNPTGDKMKTFCDKAKRAVPADFRIFSRAFTLIEILVVITCIAILASLLLPTLAKARLRSYTAISINNERQLISSWVMYAGDSNDALPNNGMPSQGGDEKRKFWIQGVFYHDPDKLNKELIVNAKYAQFAPYIRDIKVYRCPADRSLVQVKGLWYPKLRSYSMNSYVGWFSTNDTRLASNNYVYFRKTAQMIRPGPANLFVFQEVYPDSICWPYFGVYMDSTSDRFFNFPAIDHSQGGVVAFGDAHVEQHRWRHPFTLKAYSGNYHGHNDTSNLSPPKNDDVAWIRDHASVKK
jgi:prepilin-type N-terminal cleavage/methylation domain-containing protein